MVFDRFTDRARQAYAAAQDEARTLGHDRLGTEHLLLGLLRLDDGAAAGVLHSFALDLESARSKVVEEVGRGPGSPPGPLPHDRSARAALEGAQTAMIAWEHDHIDAEHLLFGLLRALPASTHRVLLGLHAEPSTLAAAIASEVAGVPRPRAFPALEDPVQRRAREIALRYAAAEHPARVPDSGDLLLGLAEEGLGVAARALQDLGVPVEALRVAVARARSEDT